MRTAPVIMWLVVTCPAIAQAGQWEQVTTAMNGSKHFIDFERVNRFDGPLWRGWVKSEAGKADKKRDSAFALSYYEVNCYASTMRTLRTTYYKADGTVAKTEESMFSDHQAPIPESVGETVLERMCKWATLSAEYQEWLEKRAKQ